LEGIVEVFALVDRPKAKYAYAWNYHDGNQDKTTVVRKKSASGFATECCRSSEPLQRTANKH